MTSQEKAKLTEQIDAAIKRRRRIVYRIAKGTKHPEECLFLSRYKEEEKALRIARKTGIGTGKRIRSMAERSARDWESEAVEEKKAILMHRTYCLFAVAEAIRGDRRHLKELATMPKMR